MRRPWIAALTFSLCAAFSDSTARPDTAVIAIDRRGDRCVRRQFVMARDLTTRGPVQLRLAGELWIPLAVDRSMGAESRSLLSSTTVRGGVRLGF